MVLKIFGDVCWLQIRKQKSLGLLLSLKPRRESSTKCFPFCFVYSIMVWAFIGHCNPLNLLVILVVFHNYSYNKSIFSGRILN